MAESTGSIVEITEEGIAAIVRDTEKRVMEETFSDVLRFIHLRDRIMTLPRELELRLSECGTMESQRREAQEVANVFNSLYLGFEGLAKKYSPIRRNTIDHYISEVEGAIRKLRERLEPYGAGI